MSSEPLRRSARLAAKRKLNKDQRTPGEPPLKKRKTEGESFESSDNQDESISVHIYHRCHLPDILPNGHPRRDCIFRNHFFKKRVPLSWNLEQLDELVIGLMPPIEHFSTKFTLSYHIQNETFTECPTSTDKRSSLEQLGINGDTECLQVRVVHRRSVRSALRMEHGLKHEPETNDCPLMRNGEKSCAVYDRLKRYQHSLQDLEHMQHHSHSGIPPVDCKYNEECKAYIRLVDGGNRLDDRCHLAIYQHPPRTVPKTVKTKYKSFTKGPKKWTQKRFESHTVEQQIEMLMDEVKRNGFEKDLMTTEGESIMNIVDEKMKHPRHEALGLPLNRAQMLSIVLYTGCECNWYLCEAERANEWNKWPVFGWTLNRAIGQLRRREYGEFPTYCGLKGVMDFDLGSGNVKKVTLGSFTSTSWDIEQAESFCGGQGMIIGFTRDMRKYGADVSWISKFPDEKEILFRPRRVNMKLISQNKKIQKVMVFDEIEERVF